MAGTLAYAGLLYWIVVTFHAAHLSTFFGVTCLLLLAAYLGLYWGIWACFVARLSPHPASGHLLPKGRRQTCPLPSGERVPEGRVRAYLPLVAAAAAWVALEYLRTYLFTGFPWTLLADSQVHNLPVIQIASLTGVYGVSFLVAMVNVVVAQSILGNKRGWVPTAIFVLCSFLFGLYRLSRITESPNRRITVALLQGNIDQYQKWDNRYVEDIEAAYTSLVDQASQSHPDLIVWPETSVPGYLLQETPLRTWLDAVVKKSRTYHLVGAPVMHGSLAMNSAFVLNPQGQVEAEYGKQHLVPFGEFVPWSNYLTRWIRVLNDLGGFAPGYQPPVVTAAHTPIGVNICYEAIFPAIVRHSVVEGAQVIANLTNDGWYMQTAGPYQHFAPNIFRAVENRRWLIRADNTGISAIVDPFGRIQAASPIFQRTIVTGSIEPRSDLTLYTRFGDWFAWLSCAVSVVALIAL